MSEKTTQCDRLLQYLMAHGTITPLEAWTLLGIYRLGARIWDLKKHGYKISTKTVPVLNQFGECCHVAMYVLENDPFMAWDTATPPDAALKAEAELAALKAPGQKTCEGCKLEKPNECIPTRCSDCTRNPLLLQLRDNYTPKQDGGKL